MNALKYAYPGDKGPIRVLLSPTRRRPQPSESKTTASGYDRNATSRHRPGLGQRIVKAMASKARRHDRRTIASTAAPALRLVRVEAKVPRSHCPPRERDGRGQCFSRRQPASSVHTSAGSYGLRQKNRARHQRIEIRCGVASGGVDDRQFGTQSPRAHREFGAVDFAGQVDVGEQHVDTRRQPRYNLRRRRRLLPRGPRSLLGQASATSSADQNLVFDQQDLNGCGMRVPIREHGPSPHL